MDEYTTAAVTQTCSNTCELVPLWHYKSWSVEDAVASFIKYSSTESFQGLWPSLRAGKKMKVSGRDGDFLPGKTTNSEKALFVQGRL